MQYFGTCRRCGYRTLWPWSCFFLVKFPLAVFVSRGPTADLWPLTSKCDRIKEQRKFPCRDQQNISQKRKMEAPDSKDRECRRFLSAQQQQWWWRWWWWCLWIAACWTCMTSLLPCFLPSALKFKYLVTESPDDKINSHYRCDFRSCWSGAAPVGSYKHHFCCVFNEFSLGWQTVFHVWISRWNHLGSPDALQSQCRTLWCEGRWILVFLYFYFTG